MQVAALHGWGLLSRFSKRKNLSFHFYEDVSPNSPIKIHKLTTLKEIDDVCADMSSHGLVKQYCKQPILEARLRGMDLLR